MADSSFVVCDVLCFLRHRFGKTSSKVVKSALVDFYDVEILSNAKSQLLKDISALDSSVKFPHVPQRRDKENRLSREVDDILSLFTCLDENKLLDALPRYVADGPDGMPPIRLYEGELNGILVMIKRLAERVDEYSSALSSVTHELRQLQAKCAPVPSAATSTVAEYRQLNKPTSSQSAVQQAKRSEIPSREVRESADVNPTNSRSQTSEQSSDGYSWAAMMSTPNRYAALAGDNERDDATDGDGDGDGERRFTTVRPRRGKRNRQPTSPQATQARPQQGEQSRRQRAPVVAGRSSDPGNKIAAAKILRKKAVFCLDNLSNSCTASDIKSFVSGLSVEVLSVFNVKPRRRRGEGADDAVDRRAFRLCINADDRERLLDPSVWPDSVLISQWYFKQQDNKRARLSTSSTSDAATEIENPSSVAVDNASDDTIIENMDSLTSDNGEQLRVMTNDGV